MTLKNLALHWQILIALTLGIPTGFLIQSSLGSDAQIISVFSLGGGLFLSLLKMCIIPLVFSSLFIGVTNVSHSKSLGRIGMRTAVYYLSTSLLAISIGLLVVNVIQPGVGANIGIGEAAHSGLSTPDSIFDIVNRIVPTNVFASMANFDMLGIIFFTMVFAIFTLKAEQKYQTPMITFVDSMYNIMMGIVGWVISLAPIGVFCLVVKLVSTTGFDVFIPLMKYLFTVVLALGFHFFIILPGVFYLFTRRNPYTYMSQMAPALLTAFSSASSAATLPLTMTCAEKNGVVSKQVSSMVLPLGATVNMDGTALYEGVAVLFIAQALGYDLSLAQQFLVLLTGLLVSIGAAGIPHAGLVMMVIILKAVGLPIEATGMIWAVDRVVDMARTSVNVWSDSIGANIISKWEPTA